ncbi:Winged helix-turn-helix DNA-binding domain [Phytophthora cactorum]|nr:Winged helix-turn-helix DNA-binding domain [Phytophthora cactorum]
MMPSLQAKEHGMLGNVFTVYELYAGGDTRHKVLEGEGAGRGRKGAAPRWLLRGIAAVSDGWLLHCCQAAVIAGETCEENGVKFLATD